MIDFFNALYLFIVDVYIELANAPSPFYAVVILFMNGLWIPVLFVFIQAGLTIWKDYRQGVHHDKTRRFILLAIDVPRDNEQSPKAVENIFTHLHGICRAATILTRSGLREKQLIISAWI